MTGFGQAAEENAAHRIAVTIRSVNHRFLDLVIRMKEEYRAFEAVVRKLLGEQLTRGRVDVRVEIETVGERQTRVEVQREAIRDIHAQLAELAREGLVTEGLTPGALFGLPDVVRLSKPADLWTEEDARLLEEVVRKALDQVVEAKELEGTHLETMLTGRLETLEELVAEIEAMRPSVHEQLATRLRERISELVDVESLAEDRMAQEVAFLVDRSDVQEELDRLTSHIAHFRELLSQDGSVGKRLDFLSQEVLRELNTLGSKGRDSKMVQLVLDSKLACEQIREQVQNIE